MIVPIVTTKISLNEGNHEQSLVKAVELVRSILDAYSVIPVDAVLTVSYGIENKERQRTSERINREVLEDILVMTGKPRFSDAELGIVLDFDKDIYTLHDEVVHLRGKEIRVIFQKIINNVTENNIAQVRFRVKRVLGEEFVKKYLY